MSLEIEMSRTMCVIMTRRVVEVITVSLQGWTVVIVVACVVINRGPVIDIVTTIVAIAMGSPPAVSIVAQVATVPAIETVSAMPAVTMMTAMPASRFYLSRSNKNHS